MAVADRHRGDGRGSRDVFFALDRMRLWTGLETGELHQLQAMGCATSPGLSRQPPLGSVPSNLPEPSGPVLATWAAERSRGPLEVQQWQSRTSALTTSGLRVQDTKPTKWVTLPQLVTLAQLSGYEDARAVLLMLCSPFLPRFVEVVAW